MYLKVWCDAQCFQPFKYAIMSHMYLDKILDSVLHSYYLYAIILYIFLYLFFNHSEVFFIFFSFSNWSTSTQTLKMIYFEFKTYINNIYMSFISITEHF